MTRKKFQQKTGDVHMPSSSLTPHTASKSNWNIFLLVFSFLNLTNVLFHVLSLLPPCYEDKLNGQLKASEKMNFIKLTSGYQHTFETEWNTQPTMQRCRLQVMERVNILLKTWMPRGKWKLLHVTNMKCKNKSSYCSISWARCGI